MDTGMTVLAVMLSGTRRARDITAEDSMAWSKMGPVDGSAAAECC